MGGDGVESFFFDICFMYQVDVVLFEVVEFIVEEVVGVVVGVKGEIVLVDEFGVQVVYVGVVSDFVVSDVAVDDEEVERCFGESGLGLGVGFWYWFFYDEEFVLL